MVNYPHQVSRKTPETSVRSEKREVNFANRGMTLKQPSMIATTIIWLMARQLSIKSLRRFRSLRLITPNGVGQRLWKLISDMPLQPIILGFTRATTLTLRPRKLDKKRLCPWKTSMLIRLSTWPRFYNNEEFPLCSFTFQHWKKPISYLLGPWSIFIKLIREASLCLLTIFASMVLKLKWGATPVYPIWISLKKNY